VIQAARSHEGVDAVNTMFQRVLQAWAVDALALRRRGLDRPCSRDGAGTALYQAQISRRAGRHEDDASAARAAGRHTGK
jgi:hypothetical protein